MTSNETKQRKVEKLVGNIASYTRLMKDLSKEISKVSAKGLAKDLINR